MLVPAGQSAWSNRTHYPIKPDKTTIGRSSACDVSINQPTVSRVHAELNWKNGSLHITHLSPINPTLVNGVPVSETCELRTGDLIEIAHGIVLRLEVFDSGGDDEATVHIRRDQRRMYAVVHADVEGYSRLIEDDDVATARQLEACLQILRREVERGSGRIVQVAGDGILMLFPSAASAVGCAIAWQRGIACLNTEATPGREMNFRIGVNSGDVLFTSANSIYGDAINIAARIQALAPPGGILVAGVVHDQLQAHEDLRFEYVGESELKNLSRKARLYRVDF